MIITIIHSALQAWDQARGLQALQGWPYPAFCALFAYMEELSDEMGRPIEFDLVAWVREYSFWETAAACCASNYKIQYIELVEELVEENENTLEQLCLDYLQHNAMVIYSGSSGLIVEDC